MGIDHEHNYKFCTKSSLYVLKITKIATVQNLVVCSKFKVNHIYRLITVNNADKRIANLYNYSSQSEPFERKYVSCSSQKFQFQNIPVVYCFSFCKIILHINFPFSILFKSFGLFISLCLIQAELFACPVDITQQSSFPQEQMVKMALSIY